MDGPLHTFLIGNSQLKKVHQGAKMCFLLLYIEYVVIRRFWWLFLHVPYQIHVKMWLLIFNCIVIMITWRWLMLTTDLLQQNCTLEVEVLCISFMNGSFIFNDFFIYQATSIFYNSTQNPCIFFLWKWYRICTYVTYLWRKLLILTSCQNKLPQF